MYSSILVPLDGSPLAARALPYATALARASRARLVLVRAVLAHTPPGIDPSEAQVRVTERAGRDLDALAEYLRATGLSVDTHVYYDQAVRAIVDLAEQQAVDLVVMSTHGRGGLGRWVYGSVADRVLQRLIVPVLLVPAASGAPWAADGWLRVVVPLDGSALAEEVLGAVRGLASVRDVELLLLRTIEPPAPFIAEESGRLPAVRQDAEVADARRYLDDLATRLRSDGLTVTTRAVVGECAPTIATAAVAYGADLLALATHGRGGLARVVFGSVTASLLHRAHTPLLLVRPTAVETPSLEPVPPGEDAPALVPLSRRELALVEEGLVTLLRDAELEAGARVRVTPSAHLAADLLARLRQAEHLTVPSPTAL
jgi:nucleotide-binding universal stress UspA family protein